MAISSDEAVAKAREFASKVGWFTTAVKVKEDASLIPAVWKVRLEGDYDIVTIEVNADSGEVLKWHSADPIVIAFERVKPTIDKLEAQGTPGRQCWEIWRQEQAKVLKKQKGPRSPNVDSLLFLKSGARNQLISNDSHRKTR